MVQVQNHNLQEHIIRRKAHDSVQVQHWNELTKIQESSEGKINEVLNKARAEGRFHDQQHGQSHDQQRDSTY